MKQIDESLGGCNRTPWAPAPPAELAKGAHNWGGFSAYGNQLYTVLVHQNKQDLENKGGAFNCMVDDAVVGGAMLL